MYLPFTHIPIKDNGNVEKTLIFHFFIKKTPERLLQPIKCFIIHIYFILLFNTILQSSDKYLFKYKFLIFLKSIKYTTIT